MKSQSMDILYVEDDATDAEFAQTMFDEVGCGEMKIRVVTDGESAAFELGLQASKERKSSPLPNMILLDLNIPRIHGKELLRRIKASDRLRSIPVVVLSTSDHQVDIDESYQLGASGFFTKASGYEESMSIFKSICGYWAKGVRLPAIPSEAS